MFFFLWHGIHEPLGVYYQNNLSRREVDELDELGGAVDSLKGREALQRDLDRWSTGQSAWHEVQQREMPGAAAGMEQC